MPYKPQEREYRSFGQFLAEGAEEDSSKLIIKGTPIVFGQRTCLFEIDGVKYYEIIDPHAPDSADLTDFIFNRNHEDTPYARTKNGSLRYQILSDRVDIDASLDSSDQRHRELYGDIKSGRIDQMSFSFVPYDDGVDYDEASHTFTVRKIKKVYDVSAVTFPAYEQTSVYARSRTSEELRRAAERLEQSRRRKKMIIQTYF